MNLEEARKAFADDKFATKTSGIVIDEVGEKSAVCSMVITEGHRNAMGAVMGGAIYTLADFAFAVASNHEQMGTVTVSSNISFMSGVKGNRLIAKAHCIKDGKSMRFFEIDITDELGTKVARAATNGARVGK